VGCSRTPEGVGLLAELFVSQAPTREPNDFIDIVALPVAAVDLRLGCLSDNGVGGAERNQLVAELQQRVGAQLLRARASRGQALGQQPARAVAALDRPHGPATLAVSAHRGVAGPVGGDPTGAERVGNGRRDARGGAPSRLAIGLGLLRESRRGQRGDILGRSARRSHTVRT